MSQITAKQAAALYLDADQAAKEAAKAKAKAAEILREAYIKTGVDFVVVDDTKVAVVPVMNRDFNVEALFAVLDPETAGLITEPKVNTTRFDAAVESGLIDSEAVTKIVTPKPTDRITVEAIA